MADTSCSRMIFTAWGIKLAIEHEAAATPIAVTTIWPRIASGLRFLARPGNTRHGVIRSLAACSPAPRQPQSSHVAASPDQPTPRAPLSILVIDDSEDERTLYQRALKAAFGERLRFCEAASGEAGFDAIVKAEPSRVLLDYSPPGRNGLEALKRIRAAHPRLPVVMLYITAPLGMRCNFLVVHDGQEGLSTIRDQGARNDPVDLILLDINMPVMNGFQMLEAMGRDAVYGRTPVVMCSGSTREEDKTRSRALGAIAYLVKTVRFEALQPIIAPARSCGPATRTARRPRSPAASMTVAYLARPSVRAHDDRIRLHVGDVAMALATPFDIAPLRFRRACLRWSRRRERPAYGVARSAGRRRKTGERDTAS
jgi:CheY-like chemotaxis protein